MTANTTTEKTTVAYGDPFDAEGFRVATSVFTIPAASYGPVHIHIPGHEHATGVLVRFVSPTVVEITREGKGDKLFVDIVAARQGMVPVRMGSADDAPTVAYLGLDTRDDTYVVSYGTSWGDNPLGEHNWHTWDTEVAALAELGLLYII